MKELSEVSDFQLMFDEDNPTNTEEILQQGISDVLLKPKSMSMADMIRLSQGASEVTEAGAAVPEKLAEFYVNQKGQVIKVANVERNGKMTQMHAIVSFDIDQLPQAGHGYTGVVDPNSAAATRLTAVPRAKVPVRDGRS